MGVVNVTPDSFSDGGPAFDPAAAVERGMGMTAAGADLVDVGGESTRPGAQPVDAEEEKRRIIAVARALTGAGVVVSVDTSKPEVAEAAIESGAEVINDVTGLRDSGMREVCSESGAGVVIMHMLGTPLSMQQDPRYGDVTAEIKDFLLARARDAEAAGIGSDRIAIDPGIGFGKTLRHNLEILGRLEELTNTRFPVMVGTSRKGFLGRILEAADLPSAPADRDGATAATTVAAILSGVAIVRVHDVATTLQAARVADAIVRGSSS